ncbi:MAG: UDP-N-acetylmuramoylalanyl-D-glutamyl-2,6-diaminopimelate--D-alanyl-D-alanine ligase (EC [uncultured Thiotrichaceae bacterium]|uniref:UDP-N-acetylmuramoyl-tripeptide--D-alanyl-D-alanine ligase n=1 Tax=uncultured Thiotrichaceae bacterium TaxID=298394 RepID=A0A6S6SB77_9GAMM|nr:MAG: UDP-N-acetylmuramoylalanyl-D-glutamyl-2,6-diaminopimelate--D-alanyl-D-alanine ligase (EC [uncultured Thiotrichaceae bacterium]
MTWLTLFELADMCGGALRGITDEAAGALNIVRVERDSRQVAAGDLFLALKGENFDAHDFVPDVVGLASATLVEHYVEADIPQVVVSDVRYAMGQLGVAWRNCFSRPVIALTGSNGKTTLKEMITAILSESGSTHSTRGNLNNDLGVPLTLYELRPGQHDYAVIEMGANHFGEIEYLANLVRPDVAVLNNAGAAHLEGFGSVAGVARAKGEIFSGLSDAAVAIINADDDYAEYWRELNKSRRVISFGMDNTTANVKGVSGNNGLLLMGFENQSVEVNLPLLGKHNAMNALAAAAAVLPLGIRLEAVKAGLEKLQPVQGRLCPLRGSGGELIIDDTYNANPSSALAAIRVLAQQNGRTLLVLGDMGELGVDGMDMHAEIGRQAALLGIDALYGIGEMSVAACDAFGSGAVACHDMDELLKLLNTLQLNENNSVLVKGSRSARMERVVDALVKQEVAA